MKFSRKHSVYFHHADYSHDHQARPRVAMADGWERCCVSVGELRGLIVDSPGPVWLDGGFALLCAYAASLV